MSVRELINKLQALDPTMEVLVEVNGEYDYMPVVQNLEVRNVGFREDPDGPDLCHDDVVVVELL